MSNAIKFTARGGRVSIAAREAEAGGIVIAVADTGIGIKREDIQTALMPFRQIDGGLDRRHEGAGLGLPLAKTLVELHGGRLEIDSEPGRGTTVRVTLPAERVLGSEAPAPASRDAGAHRAAAS